MKSSKLQDASSRIDTIVALRLGEEMSEMKPKRQRTAALQNLAEVDTRSTIAKRLGLRQSSAALASVRKYLSRLPDKMMNFAAVWWLPFGAFLELGAWNLELSS